MPPPLIDPAPRAEMPAEIGGRRDGPTRPPSDAG